MFPTPSNLTGCDSWLQDESAQSPENTPTPDALRVALAHLRNRFETLGDHSVLRVDASFPKMTEFRGFKQGADDKELCATLRTSLVKEIAADIPSTEIVNGIIAGFLGRRPRYPDNPLPERTAKRRRSVDTESPASKSMRHPKRAATVPL